MMKNNLIFDLGNTRAKVAIVCGVEIVAEWSFDDVARIDAAFVEEQVARYGVRSAVISSTCGCDAQEGLKRVVEGCVEHLLVVDAATPMPIKNSYATPETLGRDRLAAAVGAVAIVESAGGAGGAGGVDGLESDCDAIVVVDMGTAITIDVVVREGGLDGGFEWCFEGGSISPGVAMRFKALSDYTAVLPLVEPTQEELSMPLDGVAKSTREAMFFGVFGGILCEIEGKIDILRRKLCKIRLILTGGDAKNFDKRIKNRIFAIQGGVVSIGLNRILEYNEK